MFAPLTHKPVTDLRAAPVQAGAPPTVHQVLSSPGRALDPQSRAYFEPRIGADFSRVRIHSDESAARSAKGIAASAYTVGQHVVFAAGQYAPDSANGRRLLAHELAHVAQQPADAVGHLRLGGENDSAEREAASASEVLERGGTVGSMSTQPAGVVRRQPLRMGQACPTGCHAPSGTQNVSLESLHDEDQHYLPENALVFHAYLQMGEAWNEFEGCNQVGAKAIHVAEYDGNHYIAGYVITYNNPKGSSFPRPTVTVDIYGNKLGVKWHDPQAIESVMSPIDFIGPGTLRSLIGGAARLGGGLTRFSMNALTRGRALVGGVARRTMLAGRLYTAEAMTGFEAAGVTTQIGARATEPFMFAGRSAGEFSAMSGRTALQEMKPLANVSTSAPRAANATIAEAKVTGPSFADISAELGLEAPGTIRYRSAAKAAQAARQFGLESATRPAIQSHSTAGSIRKILGISGHDFQSAHIVPQAVYRALKAMGRKVSEGRALTTLLPKAAHSAFDRTWIAEWNAATGAGRAITARDVQRMVSRAIRAVDESVINAEGKAMIEDRLSKELFDELGLDASDVIIAPHP